MNIATSIAKDAKLLGRQVWCRSCGQTTTVVNGLANGWPKCCTFTMTIDHPDTWKPESDPHDDREREHHDAEQERAPERPV